jgi:CCR4-NOT transcription complex subunit 7/8
VPLARPQRCVRGFGQWCCCSLGDRSPRQLLVPGSLTGGDRLEFDALCAIQPSTSSGSIDSGAVAGASNRGIASTHSTIVVRSRELHPVPIPSGVAAGAAAAFPFAAMIKSKGGAADKSPVSAASPPSPGAANRLSLLELTSQSKDGKFLHTSGDLQSLRQAGSNLIIDVWSDNVREAFEKIMWIVEDFPYVAMDTEFPGIVARPLTTSTGKNVHAYHYQTIKLNVDLLKLIQLGLCFCNAEGEISKGLPGMWPSPPTAGSVSSTQGSASAQPGGIVYQFHFRFSLTDDMFAQDSIDLLASAGIDFAKHATQGIDVTEFSELLMTSGVVLNDDVRWLSFHSGFDFAYLLHLLLGGGQGLGGDSSLAPALPSSESDFFELLALYFPCVFDVKALLKHLPPNCGAPADLHKGGLSKLAAELKIARLGQAHQAGSDSLLTAACFFKLRELYFKEIVPPTVHQINQAASAASSAVLAQPSKDSSPAAGADKSPAAIDAAREREAYAAGTDAAAARVNEFQQQEERHLGILYGLQPAANAILKQTRDRERAQTSGTYANDADASTTISSMTSTSTATTTSTRDTSRSGSISRGLNASPPFSATFKPAGSPPNFS